MDADYIVVGTGSAGSVVANRLSADPSASVVVLEAGPRDKDKFIRIPAAFAKLFGSGMDWDYSTEPQKELEGREIYWPRVISPQRSPRTSTAAWLRAVSECVEAPEGFCETRVTQRRGARWSTADAYLKPAFGRKNLTLLTEATATRVVVEGNRAVGVEYEKDGARHVVGARREVVL